ncbi:hypothetical protein SCHPADRAFT_910752 [Schizopora paradoxa]|uniref:Uncharacterized protein n=1 Tax=Schizopora paradoxa TaxID=27342 RepID=A0A0H2R226_9AGAM|nr:hypothetical protein SCHPADRAFT_910752 [Schizopora paradoxa]
MSPEAAQHLLFSPSIVMLLCCFGATLFLVAGLAIQSMEFVAQLLVFFASSYASSHFAFETLQTVLLLTGHEHTSQISKQHYVVVRGNRTGIFDDPITYQLAIDGVIDAIHAVYSSLEEATERFELAKKEGVFDDEKVGSKDVELQGAVDILTDSIQGYSTPLSSPVQFLDAPPYRNQDDVSHATTIGSDSYNNSRSFGTDITSNFPPSSPSQASSSPGQQRSPKTFLNLTTSTSSTSPPSPSEGPVQRRRSNSLPSNLSGYTTELDSECARRDSWGFTNDVWGLAKFELGRRLELTLPDDSNKENIPPQSGEGVRFEGEY